MVAVEKKIETKGRKKKKEEIPPYLIYETLEGIPVYYRGYIDVLNGDKSFDEIKAWCDLPIFMLNMLKDYFQPVLGERYLIMIGEVCTYISDISKATFDLSIFPKGFLSLKEANNSYLRIPPKAVVQVDTKADFDAFPFSPGEYYMKKTEILLNFGVKEVIWIFTSVEKVMVARPNQPWLTVDWKDEIEIMGHKFSLQQVIEESEKQQ